MKRSAARVVHSHPPASAPRRAPRRILAAVVVGALFTLGLLLCIELTRTLWTLRHEGEATTATVVERQARPAARRPRALGPNLTVAWTDRDGVAHHARLNAVQLFGRVPVGTLGRVHAEGLGVGDTAAVVYDPSDPDRVYLARSADASAWYAALLGTALCAVGLALCLWLPARRRRRHRREPAG